MAGYRCELPDRTANDVLLLDRRDPFFDNLSDIPSAPISRCSHHAANADKYVERAVLTDRR